MQIVDYWVGVPICFLLSVFNFFIVLFSNKNKTIEAKKILFIELSEMGSSIIAYSSLKKVTKKYGVENVYFLIFSKNRESVDLLDIIPKENVLVLSDKSFLSLTLDTLKSLFKFRRLGINTVIDMELFSRFTNIISFLSGASIRIGFSNYTSEGLYRGSLLTHPVKYNPHQHMVYNFLSLVEVLDSSELELPLIKTDFTKEDLSFLKVDLTEEIKEIKLKLKSKCSLDLDNNNIIVLNPDPGDVLPIRGWGKENFLELSKKILLNYPNVIILVMGLKSSKPYATFLEKNLDKNKFIDFCGETKNLKELLALLKLSSLFITNDSGPAHIASLINMETVVFFGPETPSLYSPLSSNSTSFYKKLSCSPCLSAGNHRYTTCKRSKCLEAIKVDEVMKYVFKRLDN